MKAAFASLYLTGQRFPGSDTLSGTVVDPNGLVPYAHVAVLDRQTLLHVAIVYADSLGAWSVADVSSDPAKYLFVSPHPTDVRNAARADWV